MANTQTAFGLRHIGFLSGGAPDYQLNSGTILSTNTTKIFFGDPIVMNATTGFIEQLASTTAQLVGVFQGCDFIPVGGLGIPQWSPYWPGSAAVNATAYFIDAPSAKFLAAALNTAIVTANIGENVTVNIGTGSTVGGGFSGATLDQAGLTTATTAPFKVIGLYPGIGNGSDASSAYNWVMVTFNNQRFRSQVGA